jgi:hypothetical protein
MDSTATSSENPKWFIRSLMILDGAELAKVLGTQIKKRKKKELVRNDRRVENEQSTRHSQVPFLQS